MAYGNHPLDKQPFNTPASTFDELCSDNIEVKYYAIFIHLTYVFHVLGRLINTHILKHFVSVHRNLVEIFLK